jgi:hypothetical protein
MPGRQEKNLRFPAGAVGEGDSFHRFTEMGGGPAFDQWESFVVKL